MNIWASPRKQARTPLGSLLPLGGSPRTSHSPWHLTFPLGLASSSPCANFSLLHPTEASSALLCLRNFHPPVSMRMDTLSPRKSDLNLLLLLPLFSFVPFPLHSMALGGSTNRSSLTSVHPTSVALGSLLFLLETLSSLRSEGPTCSWFSFLDFFSPGAFFNPAFSASLSTGAHQSPSSHTRQPWHPCSLCPQPSFPGDPRG